MMSESTVKAVVATDVLPYKWPGQKRPEPPRKYVTLHATRGETIELDKSDFDRFQALGSVVEDGTREAEIAKVAGPKWGPPAGAQPLGDPSRKLVQQAEHLGLARRVAAATVGADVEDDGGVSGEIPEGLDETNESAVGSLNVAQLKLLAKQRGIEVEAKATKPMLVEAIVKNAQVTE